MSTARDRAQIERILSLDVDAAGFADVGRRDPVIARLQSAAPGLRPPQIHSAYEAAVCCILTARRSPVQARHLRTALARAAGTVLTVDGVEVTCRPPPSDLLDPDLVRGPDATRRERLTGIARAALDGRLDTAALAAQPPEQARTALEELPGIGPFSSAIITVRSLGHTDHLTGPLTELNRLLGSPYDLGHDATSGELDGIAAPWSPWRTWSQLHIRSVSPRLAREAVGRPVRGRTLRPRPPAHPTTDP